MRKMYLPLFLLFVLSIAFAQSTEPVMIYDVIDMSTDNFQGDVRVISGLDFYTWGYELGYLNERGFADKHKKVTGTLALEFLPVQDDGSYCKINRTCSWEKQTVRFTTESLDQVAYLPAGESYNTKLYFYVASDGSTYWAKSGRTDGPNSHIDLSFEDSTNGYLARAAPESIAEETDAELEQYKEKEPEKEQIVEPVETHAVEKQDNNLILIAMVSLAVILLLVFMFKDSLKPNK